MLFVRWQWRRLPHAVQILEEVTGGWGRSNDNIGLHSSGDSSCVDTCQSGKAAKALCVCACVYSWRKGFKWRARGMNPKADRHSATWKRKQNRSWKAESIARRWDRWWEKSVEGLLEACTPGMAGLWLGEGERCPETSVLSPSLSAGSPNPVCAWLLCCLHAGDTNRRLFFFSRLIINS